MVDAVREASTGDTVAAADRERLRTARRRSDESGEAGAADCGCSTSFQIA
jgi:hypothetical protein